MLKALTSLEELLNFGIDVRRFRRSDQSLADLATNVLRRSGEASVSALALSLIQAYGELSSDEREDFFFALLNDFGADQQALDAAIEAYQDRPDPSSQQAFVKAAVSKRQSLFKQINAVQGGTDFLIKMREDLFEALRVHEELKPVDQDLEVLFGFWFNRGFLELRQLDWTTPAHILEKLIAYEAVHAIKDWDDLRRRLEKDRRCFAFFHPALPDEPLIFVEVALVEGIATSVQTLLTDEIGTPEKADTAIFYSISNCHNGLRSVSFGDSLIKQVVAQLSDDFPKIKTFSTLSPVPGFIRWLKKAHEDLAETYEDALKTGDETGLLPLKDQLMKRCAQYLLAAKRGLHPIDPVARFHLRNGAMLHAVNWGADVSESGLGQSAGIMVNYVYEHDKLLANHEAFVNAGVIPCTIAVTLMSK